MKANSPATPQRNKLSRKECERNLIRQKKLTLTFNPLTWKIWWSPNNASKWQIRFNSAFKGLNHLKHIWLSEHKYQNQKIQLSYVDTKFQSHEPNLIY